MHERIEATVLIPGRGEPIPEGVVVLDGAVIRYAGPADGAPQTPGATVVRAHTVMPGLWDAHVHLMGATTLDLGRLPLEPSPLRAVRATADLRAALDVGVTSVRELGGLGLHLARAVSEGVIEGPNIYSAGAILSTTGGHGDLHSYPLAWVHDHSGLTGEARLADGPAECAKATREQLRRNAQVIKICASGGVLSEVDHPLHQQFTDAELRAIVDVAGMADRSVAAHCHGKAGILAALRAGVRTIEHGTYLDEECAAAMRETGAILVPTRTIVEEIRESRAAPAYAQAKLDALADTHAGALTLAYESGVRIASGSDIGPCSGSGPASWGRNGRELVLLAAGGMTGLAAIEAATATGPETLGKLAPRSGQLQVGYDADVLTLDVNPLDDLSVFASAGHITGVWRGGRRVKGEGPQSRD
jgi:imidazolonepropionase-like amidohydrolase